MEQLQEIITIVTQSLLIPLIILLSNKILEWVSSKTAITNNQWLEKITEDTVLSLMAVTEKIKEQSEDGKLTKEDAEAIKDCAIETIMATAEKRIKSITEEEISEMIEAVLYKTKRFFC